MNNNPPFLAIGTNSWFLVMFHFRCFASQGTATRTFPSSALFKNDLRGASWSSSVNLRVSAIRRLSQAPDMNIGTQSRQCLIQLPNTWRGRKAKLEMVELWEEGLRDGLGRRAEQIIAERKEPLILKTESALIGTTRIFRRDGIIFTSTHPKAQELLRIPSVVPWSRKSRWVRWITKFFLGYYASTLLIFCLYWDRVPISGRWRLGCVPYLLVDVVGIDDKSTSHNLKVLEHCLLPYQDSQAQRIEHILTE